MPFLFWTYFTVFMGASLAGTQQGFAMQRRPLVVILETVVNSVAASGMLIYYLDANVPMARQWWWLVAPAIAAAFLIFAILDIRWLRDHPPEGLPPEYLQQMETYGVGLAVFLFVPATIMNVLLGYSA